MTPDAPVPRLALSGISKQFPGCRANDGVGLTLMPGEIHALLGENGAGKSTLVKIIYGVLQADSGRMEWDGRPVRIASPAAARRLGIGMVFQHFSLFESLSVAENIALGLDRPGPMKALVRRITDLSARYGLALDPARPVHSLSVGERQRVEIVRCLLGEPRLLIMDEPTSVLTPQEVEGLFAVLRQLAAEGRTILYISHKLDEIRALCGRATVMRAGRVVGACDPATTESRAMAEMMIGSGLAVPSRRRRADAPQDAVLELCHLFTTSDDPFAVNLGDVSLDVRAGEIVGIAGVAGNGQAELLSALSGEARSPDPGMIVIGGVAAGHLGARARRSLGLAFVPEERLGRGAVPEMSLADNALLSGYGSGGMVRRGLVRFGRARRYAERVIQQFGVATRGHATAARALSGGNLQKFIIGREILQNPRLLIAAQPTWGVDAGAAAQIHQALLDLAQGGTALLIVSQDLDELFTLSDRIAVMHGGRLSATTPVDQTSVEQIGLCMGGIFEDSPESDHASA
ncbi:galactose/methyl galactoside import ATP-binding protein MglA [mine drainage metagenome]|uniref:Galactose/methyl galactoside import ATP-binding protein MglA n=1 Tax=mine drainage metagenome TaxID=410659 RepID=A0A1J5QYS9_9ZZZZ